MLVVIGIIAIVTVSVLPSLKGLYRDFKIRQTIEETDTFITGLRSYYLIMNEFPSDSMGGSVNTTVDWSLPKNYYNSSNNKLNISPYQGSMYDFEQYTTGNESYFNGYGAVFLNLRGITDKNIFDTYTTKLSNLYPGIKLSNGDDNNLWITFPEMTKEFCAGDPQQYRNQYR